MQVALYASLPFTPNDWEKGALNQFQLESSSLGDFKRGLRAVFQDREKVKAFAKEAFLHLAGGLYMGGSVWAAFLAFRDYREGLDSGEELVEGGHGGEWLGQFVILWYLLRRRSFCSKIAFEGAFERLKQIVEDGEFSRKEVRQARRLAQFLAEKSLHPVSKPYPYLASGVERAALDAIQEVREAFSNQNRLLANHRVALRLSSQLEARAPLIWEVGEKALFSIVTLSVVGLSLWGLKLAYSAFEDSGYESSDGGHLVEWSLQVFTFLALIYGEFSEGLPEIGGKEGLKRLYLGKIQELKKENAPYPVIQVVKQAMKSDFS